MYKSAIVLPLALGQAALGLAKCSSFCIEVFYVMGKVLVGELSCMWTGLVAQQLYLDIKNLHVFHCLFSDQHGGSFRR